MVCARTRAAERHTYEDIDAYGFSDASVGAVRARAGFPIKVDDQIVIAELGAFGRAPCRRPGCVSSRQCWPHNVANLVSHLSPHFK